jgi:hypothetical protein
MPWSKTFNFRNLIRALRAALADGLGMARTYSGRAGEGQAELLPIRRKLWQTPRAARKPHKRRILA